MADSGDSSGGSEAVKELEDHVHSVIFRAKELGRHEVSGLGPGRIVEARRELQRTSRELLEHISIHYKPRVPEQSYHHGEE